MRFNVQYDRRDGDEIDMSAKRMIATIGVLSNGVLIDQRDKLTDYNRYECRLRLFWNNKIKSLKNFAKTFQPTVYGLAVEEI